MLTMRLQAKTGSHLPVLMKLLNITDGDVLEMGMGYFSTTFLHWACLGRNLVSYESEVEFYEQFARGFKTDNHKLYLVNDWDLADIEKPWDIALIDHSPSLRRAVDIRRLANTTKYIVVHDTDWRQGKYYHYEEVLPLFKYRYDHIVSTCHTSVVSNLVNLAGFKV